MSLHTRVVCRGKSDAVQKDDLVVLQRLAVRVERLREGIPAFSFVRMVCNYMDINALN